ncbi:hypothetical protein [Nocardioides panaciterrulae]|uniref:Sulfotransferase family protein n=1 Tax=Nocardioides panaciterrulae TaxID=661492 RepID=A0A7Y9E518_9ACTN|nr:hypothetical protein [Nocardioides panaciterrulae]NYD40981.1 hypothetical protein [Nocardioides panaciterrulae]
MAERLVLHVGLMKSGTTFVQGRCNANRERLAAQGILFPGPSWARQVHAVQDFLEMAHARPGKWAALREEIQAHPGTAILSMEYLGPIRPVRIQQLVEEFPGTELTVVVTLRDLGRNVPAMWQESVKNRKTWTWAEYVHGVEHEDDEAGRHFWNQQGAARVLRRWAESIGVDHVVVVSVPPPGAPPELLWERFSEAAGIKPDTWDDAPRANESLGAASAVLMRRLNTELAGLSRRDYTRRVKAFAKHTLVRHKGEEEPIGFAVPRWLRKRSGDESRRIAKLGVPVIGDLADLEPLDVRGVDPMAVTAEQEREAALAGLTVLLRDGDRALKRRDRAGAGQKNGQGNGPKNGKKAGKRKGGKKQP